MKKRFAMQKLLCYALLASVFLSACQNTAPSEDDIPFCTSKMLRSSSVMEGATGFTFASINYTNTTKISCKLPVPPKIRYTNTTGVVIEIEDTFENYQRDTNTVEYTFETISSGTEVILPASETAQLRLRWVSSCPPVTSNGFVALLTLSSPEDVIPTIIFDGARTCNQEGWLPQVQTTGYIRVVDR